MLILSSYFSWARRKKVKVMNVEMEYLVGGGGRRHLVILGLSNNTFFYIGGPYKNNLQLIPFRVL